MLTFATVLFRANDTVPEYGRHYDTTWADKLYRALARHHKNPRLVCFTDRDYKFGEPIEQIRLTDEKVGWLSCMDMFRLDGTVLAMGLDTIITGNMDALAEYKGELALCDDQYNTPARCNGVMLFNEGPRIWQEFRNTENREGYKLGQYPSELAWLRSRYCNCETVDQLWPGWFCSIKWHILKGAYDRATVRAVYFHGNYKPNNMAQYSDCQFLKDAWI